MAGTREANVPNATPVRKNVIVTPMRARETWLTVGSCCGRRFTWGVEADSIGRALPERRHPMLSAWLPPVFEPEEGVRRSIETPLVAEAIRDSAEPPCSSVVLAVGRRQLFAR